MKLRKAVYAASLDPITNGHINVIDRMAPLFDELVVLVAVDSRKNYTFSPAERAEMARSAVAHQFNVTVDLCIGHYVVKHAESIDAQVVVRGLRSFKDLEDEQIIAEENRRICPQIETIWVPCLPHLMHVSSSMVKGHVGVDPGWEDQVARSVPAAVVVKLKEKLTLEMARRHWAALMSELGNPQGAEGVFRDLLARYAEPHRAYHTATHIVAMLDGCESAALREPATALAIWFHDAVYDPRADDNEERSAAVAAAAIQRLGLPVELAERVQVLILATRHTAAPADPTAALLVDLDLAILGRPPREFEAYEEAIRKEYDWASEVDFRSGRARVLQSFLDRPFIYATETFRSRYEVVARDNLARSIARLRA